MVGPDCVLRVSPLLPRQLQRDMASLSHILPWRWGGCPCGFVTLDNCLAALTGFTWTQSPSLQEARLFCELKGVENGRDPVWGWVRGWGLVVHGQWSASGPRAS